MCVYICIYVCIYVIVHKMMFTNAVGKKIKCLLKNF